MIEARRAGSGQLLPWVAAPVRPVVAVALEDAATFPAGTLLAADIIVAETHQLFHALENVARAIRMSLVVRPDITLLQICSMVAVARQFIEGCGNVPEAKADRVAAMALLHDVMSWRSTMLIRFSGGSATTTYEVPSRIRELSEELSRSALRLHYHQQLEPASPPQTPGPPAAFLLEGGVWRITFNGRTISLSTNLRGLRHLHALLSHAGQPVIAEQLLGGDPGHQAESPGDEVSDRRALREYKRRLDEIEAELDVAGGYDDSAAQERLKEEKRQLLEMVGTSTGLGGRSRRLGDSKERVRLRVAQAIQRAMAKIQDLHPDLHEHLKEGIQTPAGSAPCYSPRVLPVWMLR